MQQLIQDLENGTPELRLRAIGALGSRLRIQVNPLIAFWRGDSEAIQALIKVLGDDTVVKGHPHTVAQEANSALSNAGIRTIQPLVNALNRKDLRLKVVETLWSLQRKGEPVHRQIVQQVLAAVRNPATREGTMATLAYFIQHELALRSRSLTLQWTLQSRTWGDVLAGELARYGETLASLRYSRDVKADFEEQNFIRALIGILSRYKFDTSLEDFRREVAGAIATLVRIGEPAIKPLVDVTCHGTDDGKYLAKRPLVQIGEPAVSTLIMVMESKGSQNLGSSGISPAAAAAEILGDIGSPQAVDTLVRALRSKDRALQWNAIDALGKIGDKGCLKPLLDFIEDPELRARVANALAGSPSLMKYLRSMEKQASQFFCQQCLLRFIKREASPGPSSGKRLTYYVCRKCHLATSAVENVSRVVVNIDISSEKVPGRALDELELWEDSKVGVNWFRHPEPFDFDEVYIADAADFEVEEFVMKVRNDTDSRRRSRYRRMPVFVSQDHRLSQAKLNLLKDSFGTVEFRC